MGYSEIKGQSLSFVFPEHGPDCRLDIGFIRTLRLPDDNKEYGLPPGLGQFELSHVDDHKGSLPAKWSEHGGVFMPMWQAEAMWLRFDNPSGWPFAVKIAAGKVNALTGDLWANELSPKGGKQDYMVSPTQPWLDGFCIGEGTVRQFVAMPQGSGYTAEEQVTGKAEHGGLQILVYPMAPQARLRLAPPFEKRRSMAKDLGGVKKGMCASASVSGGGFEGGSIHEEVYSDCMDGDVSGRGIFESTATAGSAAPTPMSKGRGPAKEMGLAAGGLMRQEVYADPWDAQGREVWSQGFARCFAHLVDARDYQQVMGRSAPQAPPTPSDYRSHGLPWFDYYDPSSKAIKGSEELAGLDSVAAMGVKKGEKPLPDHGSAPSGPTIKLGPKAKGGLDGSW